MKLLDKNSPVPLYYQLYTSILADIRSGVLKPGDMLPPEKQIMEKYDVSRDTVRHALNDLAREGYLTRAKSKGTIVTGTVSRVFRLCIMAMCSRLPARFWLARLLNHPLT